MDYAEVAAFARNDAHPEQGRVDWEGGGLNSVGGRETANICAEKKKKRVRRTLLAWRFTC